MLGVCRRRQTNGYRKWKLPCDWLWPRPLCSAGICLDGDSDDDEGEFVSVTFTDPATFEASFSPASVCFVFSGFTAVTGFPAAVLGSDVTVVDVVRSPPGLTATSFGGFALTLDGVVV